MENKINPAPDWSKAIFEAAAQCCEIRENLAKTTPEPYEGFEIVDSGCCSMPTTPPKFKLKVESSNESIC